ncbi:hypothetical protein T440DRAFT_467293 [Plenodomus tracheiphilus IPT5]|uniref:RING-type domain-containing protein n=1 Tax=Plenodomus tracheiphilus IPT5 TaxID=1408161 RepID=A0A6A7B996_9PLEO|nr:hypothetical protein T440DRAFT_467293 [Plenodomus tracheiphilus IPT5]
MSQELDNSLSHSMRASESTIIHNHLQARMKDLVAVRKFRQNHSSLNSAYTLAIPVEEIRTLEQRQLLSTGNPSRLKTLSDIEVQEQVGKARDWLFDILDCHDLMFDREHNMRMFKSAVERDFAGRQDSWSERERIYMALTDPAIPTPEDRLRSAYLLVLHMNLAVRLPDVSKFAAVRMARIQNAKSLDDDLHKTREGIVDKINSNKVDHFACAVPLSSLQPSATSSVVDDNAGSCPICQNSYTDLSAFKIKHLIADYPVRIKHCGHVVGKSCLERWMATPRINPAKYPHRTCPLCRVKIEGVQVPPVPQTLKKHLRSDRRAMETARELVYGYDLEPEECHEAVIACMSMSITCNELLAEIHRQKIEGNSAHFDENKKILSERLEDVKKEMRAWGFRGNAVWNSICNEWMNVGVIRTE